MSRVTSRRRVLVLAPFPPRADGAHGGSRLMAQWLGQLARRHRVALLHLRGGDEPGLDPALGSRCELVREIVHHAVPAGTLARVRRRSRLGAALLAGRPPWVGSVRLPALGAALRELVSGWSPDIVQLEYHVMGQYAGVLDCSAPPRVLTSYEPGAAAAHDRHAAARGLARAIAALELRAWQRYERAVLRAVQAAVVFSDRDRQALLRLAGRTPVVRITPGLDLPTRPLSAAGTDSAGLLFVGNFVHPPNASAARRLVAGILPRVRASHPGATVTVVGPDPPPDLHTSEDRGVTVTGWVSDTAPYVDRAAVVVAPIAEGGGVRVKVLEALAAGKAVVASRLAAEGIAQGDSGPLLLADTDEEFAAAVVSLLSDPRRREALGSRARAWAEAHLGWERCMDAFGELYERLLRGGSGPQGPEEPA